MIPILFESGPVVLQTHDVFTVLGLFVGLGIYYAELRRRRMLEPRIVAISFAAVIGGGIGARLITAWEHLPYYEALGDAPLTYVITHSGKSIIGGLAGGYLAIVLAKRALGYRRSTGDCYALAIPIGTAIGRIGCFLSELPLGTPTDLPWGMTVSSAAAARFAVCPGCGGPMHPSMVYEILFNLVAAALILRFRGRVIVQGDLLKVYLLSAGVFRFLVEFVRANPVQALGLSGPQLVLIPLVGLLLLHFARQLRRGVYRMPPAPRPAFAFAGATAREVEGP